MNDEQARLDRQGLRYLYALLILGLFMAIGAFNGLRLLIVEWYSPPHAACSARPLDSHTDSNQSGEFRREPNPAGDAGAGARIKKIT